MGQGWMGQSFRHSISFILFFCQRTLYHFCLYHMVIIYERKWENCEMMSREPSLYLLLKRSNKFKETEIINSSFLDNIIIIILTRMNYDKKIVQNFLGSKIKTFLFANFWLICLNWSNGWLWRAHRCLTRRIISHWKIMIYLIENNRRRHHKNAHLRLLLNFKRDHYVFVLLTSIWFNLNLT